LVIYPELYQDARSAKHEILQLKLSDPATNYF